MEFNRKRKGKENSTSLENMRICEERLIDSWPTSLRSLTWNDSDQSTANPFIVTLLTNYLWRSRLSIITGKRPNSQVNIRDIVAQMPVTYPHANHRIARVGIPFEGP